MEAAVDISNMPFSQGAKARREVNKWWTLLRIWTAQPDNRNLCESAPVCLEDGVDESGSAYAEGRYGFCRYISALQDLSNSYFNALRNIWSRRSLVIRENAASGFMEACYIKKNAVGVCAFVVEISVP